MTGLDKIVEEIQQAAQTQADEIIEAANNEADAIRKESTEKINTRCNAIISNAETAAASTVDRSTSSVELQHRQDMLASKQSILKDTIEMAQEAVARLPQEQYLALLMKLAESTQVTGTATLQVNEKDRPLMTPSFLEHFPPALSVTLADTPAKIVGGFLLHTDNIVVNSSVEAIFDRYKDEITDVILSVLFG